MNENKRSLLYTIKNALEAMGQGGILHLQLENKGKNM